MRDYKPPFTITNEILMQVSSISEKIGRITAIGNLESKGAYEVSADYTTTLTINQSSFTVN